LGSSFVERRHRAISSGAHDVGGVASADGVEFFRGGLNNRCHPGQGIGGCTDRDTQVFRLLPIALDDLSPSRI
jgi:hypothetical protein